MTALLDVEGDLAVTHVITSADEAVEVAHKVAASVAASACERDRNRVLPARELDSLSASGLLGVTVPARFGGAAVPASTLGEVFRVVAGADASLAQIPHSHFVFLRALELAGTEAQQRRWFGEALRGARFANAQSERGSKTIQDDATTLTRHGDGYLLDGEKFYCTGALFADWLVVRAVLSDAEPLPNGKPAKAVAFIRRDTAGVTVEDDWDGMGQRTTASGTVRLDSVAVDADAVVPYSAIFDGPTTYGARAQLAHAALDTGIARGALDAAVTAVAKSRPWFEADVDTAAEDPLVVQQAGELEIAVRAAEALLREAGAAVDAAERDLSDESTARASLAVAVAKVAGARASVDVGSQLFELGGSRAAGASANLSRYWRDARTHTLHDPTRWKVQHVGRWLLTGTPPPRHGTI